MDTIVELMFSLINNGVFGKEIDKEKFNNLTEEDYKKLFKLSKSHDLAHIVGYAIGKNNLFSKGSAVFKAFQNETFMAVYRYESISYELNSICEALEKAEIPFIPLKGSVIRKYYPEPWMRTSCDIDILVHEGDLDKTVNHLVETLNYKCDGKRDYHDISLFSPSGVHLELHFNIQENMENIDRLLSKVWDYARPIEEEKFNHVVTNEYYMFHIISHMAYHFTSGGCGIRPLLDLQILNNNINYDKEILSDFCEKCDIKTFYIEIEKLSKFWFSDGPESELVDNIQQFILTGGVYGNVENKVAVGKNKSGGRTKYIISRIFLPYESLKLYYPSLNGHKWLTPFYEIRRLFRVLFKGRLKGSVNEWKATKNISKGESDKTAEMLKNLGL